MDGENKWVPPSDAKPIAQGFTPPADAVEVVKKKNLPPEPQGFPGVKPPSTSQSGGSTSGLDSGASERSVPLRVPTDDEYASSIPNELDKVPYNRRFSVVDGKLMPSEPKDANEQAQEQQVKQIMSGQIETTKNSLRNLAKKRAINQDPAELASIEGIAYSADWSADVSESLKQYGEKEAENARLLTAQEVSEAPEISSPVFENVLNQDDVINKIYRNYNSYLNLYNPDKKKEIDGDRESGRMDKASEYKFFEKAVINQKNTIIAGLDEYLQSTYGVDLSDKSIPQLINEHPEDKILISFADQYNQVEKSSKSFLVNFPEKMSQLQEQAERQDEIDRDYAEAKRKMTSDIASERASGAWSYLTYQMDRQVGRAVISGVANLAKTAQMLTSTPDPRLKDIHGLAESISDYLDVEVLSNTLLEPTKIREASLIEKSDAALLGYKVNQEVLLPRVTNSLTTTIMMLSGGNFIGQGISKLGASANLSQNMGLVTSSFVLTAGDYYDKAIEKGLTRDQASAFSVASALQTSLLETLSPNRVLFGGEVRKKLTQSGYDALKKGASMSKALRDNAAMMLKEIAKENLQEMSQLIADKGMEYVFDAAVLDKQTFAPELSPEEVLETLLITTLNTGLISSPGLRSRSHLEKSINYVAAENMDVLRRKVAADLTNGNISQKEGDAIVRHAEEYQKVVKGLPEGMNESQRIDMADLIFTKRQMDAKEKGAHVDDVIVRRNKVKKEVLNQEIENVADGKVVEKVNLDPPSYKIGGKDYGREDFMIEMSKPENEESLKSGNLEVTVNNDPVVAETLKKLYPPETKGEETITPKINTNEEKTENKTEVLSDQEALMNLINDKASSLKNMSEDQKFDRAKRAYDWIKRTQPKEMWKNNAFVNKAVSTFLFRDQVNSNSPVENVRVEDLDKYRIQPESIKKEKLSEDIRKRGIQNPVVLTYYPYEGKVYLSDGHNRLDEAKRQGIKVVPTKVILSTDKAPSFVKDAPKQIDSIMEDFGPSSIGFGEKPYIKETSKKKYFARAVEHYSDKNDLVEAIKANGLDNEVVSHKRVDKIASGIVDQAKGKTPEETDKNFQKIRQDIYKTTNEDYRNNDDLSTLHAQIYHKITDYYASIGDAKNFSDWMDDFQKGGAIAGRFVSAMQHDASPEAIRNKSISTVIQIKKEALSDVDESGKTHEQAIKEIKKQFDLTNEEVKRLQDEVKKLHEELKNRPKEEKPEYIPSDTDKLVRIRKKRENGWKKMRNAARRSRGETTAGGPVKLLLDVEFLSGIRDVISSFIEEGFYRADQLKRRVLKDAKENLSKEDYDDLNKNWTEIYNKDKDVYDKLSDEARKNDFVEKIESAAKKQLSKPKSDVAKSPEDVLLKTLLAKVKEDFPKKAPEKKQKSSYTAVIDGIKNREFSNEAWREAMNNVEIWMQDQGMSPNEISSATAMLEDSISLFMESPFADSDLRKAIRQGATDLGKEVEKIVKQHWTVQNSELKTLSEKLIEKLGLTPEEAELYEQRITEAYRELFEEKRVAQIRKALNLDKSDVKKERKSAVNRRIVDKIIEGINLGMLTEDVYQNYFSEKYGFPNLTKESLDKITRFNDLIHIHQGDELSRKYAKDMMDYVQSLNPKDAAWTYSFIQSLMVKAMLTGIKTVTVNIPIGSYLSYFSNTLPRFFSNPVAYIEAVKAFNKSGLQGIGRRSFMDVMKSGYNILDEGASKFEERRDTRGDYTDYLINTFDFKKLSNDVRKAKTPKAKINAAAILATRTYLQGLQMANFARAFDVIINHRGSEIQQFMDEYNDLRKQLGKNSFTDRYNFKLGAEISKEVEKRMAYDPDAKAEVEEDVSQKILEMEARGEKVTPGLRQRLIKEGMQNRRDSEKVKDALRWVKTSTLMEDPQGVSGRFYEALSSALEIRNKDTGRGKKTDWVSGFAKTAMKSMIGFFLRISVVSAQRAIEATPVLGLVSPGMFYDYKKVKADKSDPNSKEEWRRVPQDAKTRNQRLAINAMTTSAMLMAAMAMFDIDDDEVVLDEDRWLDITGYGTGKYYNNEQLNRLDNDGNFRKREDFMLSVKIGDQWHDILPARLIPQMLPLIAILGGMRDEVVIKETEDDLLKTSVSKKEFIESMLYSFPDVVKGLTEQSFSQIPKITKDLMYAAEKEGPGGIAMEALEKITSPARTAIYPNLYRDLYNESQAIVDDEKKSGTGFSALAKDVPILEDMMLVSTHDVFGYPKKRTFKVVDAGKENIITGNLIDHKWGNEERFSNKAWEIKMKYRPDIIINGYWPKGETYEIKNFAAEKYGERMRKFWEDPKYLDKIKDESDEKFFLRLKNWDEVSTDYAKKEMKKQKKTVDEKE